MDAGVGGQEGYLALPPGQGPGVLVLHDAHGLLPHIRQRCESLAAAGFVAYAPELSSSAAAALPAVVAALRTHPAVAPPSCAAVGFGPGGRLALELAARERIDAVVSYYAVLAPEQAADLLCPVLLLLAEVDGWEPPDAPERFTSALRLMGTPAEQVIYPGTVEGFANLDLPTAQPLAAERAWDRTVNFLAARLP